MYSKTDVIDSFRTLIRERTALPNGLEDLWFDNALGKYEFEICTVGYDSVSKNFSDDTPRSTILIIAYIMKVMYCEREMSRVNKINNIITKDVSLNGNGDTKKMTYAELALEKSSAEDYINKSKTSSYGD